MIDAEDSILERAIAVRMASRTSQVIEDYIGTVRMQTAEAQQQTLEDTRILRDQIVDMQRTMISATEKVIENQQALLEQLADLMSALQQSLSRPPIVNITQEPQQVRMLQQPVNVDVPQTQVTVTPNIEVPSPNVVIEPATTAMPKKLIVKHSDGTRSTIEIGK